MTEVVETAEGLTEYSLYIDGEWSPAASGDRFESINPFTGESWATLALAGPEDVDRAVAAAWRGFAEWKQLLRKERGQLLWRLADLIEANADTLAAIETRDNGKLIREMLGQVKSLPDYYRYWAGWADKIAGSVLPLDKPGVFHYITREPLGVIACITPWNSPLLLLTWKLAPALACGNAVVVKPSEHASASTVAFCELVTEAGFPRGLVNVVTGAAETAQALVSHPRVSKVAFTGGGETGRLVAAAAARELTPVSLELGGKSPNIVFEDADLDNATKGVMAGIFGASRTSS
jgi:(Z)-2-((N-methylformamido)methylene)-5-hydroxybutyrolactone dehydrogenase